MKYWVLTIFLFLSPPIIAQENLEVSYEDDKFFASVGVAYTFIPRGEQDLEDGERGYFVPGIGADILYRFSTKWEAGLMWDLELGEYIIGGDEPFEREFAMMFVPVAAYTPIPKVTLFTGPGIEIDPNKTMFIYRVGIEYVPRISGPWVMPIGFFMDFKEAYESYSFIIAIGRTF